MSFENPTTPQQEKTESKQELIDRKMAQAEKLQEEIDNLLDQMPEGELKANLQGKIAELKQVNVEIVELIED